MISGKNKNMEKIIGSTKDFGNLCIDKKTNGSSIILSYREKVLDQWDKGSEDRQIMALALYDPMRYLLEKKAISISVGDNVLFCPEDVNPNNRTIRFCSFRVKDLHLDSKGIVYSVTLQNKYDSVLQYRFVDVSYIRLITKK